MKWNDGQPFSADDVAYTFDLMKRVPATDLYALWTGAGLRSVTAAGNKVTMTFDQAGRAVLLQLRQPGRHRAEAHLLHRDRPPSTRTPGTTERRSAPARTRWTPARANNIQYVANPDYWQPGKPYIEKVQYPAYLDNGPANLDLASGKAQWGSQFIPNIRAAST